jgi:hypothetical protein
MEIVSAIRTISLGRRHLSQSVAELLAQQLNSKDGGAPHEQLSEREFQVFLRVPTIGRREQVSIRLGAARSRDYIRASRRSSRQAPATPAAYRAACRYAARSNFS